MYRKIGRTVAAAIIATIASAAFASSANAALLTESADSCDDGPITQPFLRFGDGASYKGLPGGTITVAFRFTALSGAWQIDDVYVDPRVIN